MNGLSTGTGTLEPTETSLNNSTTLVLGLIQVILVLNFSDFLYTSILCVQK